MFVIISILFFFSGTIHAEPLDKYDEVLLFTDRIKLKDSFVLKFKNQKGTKFVMQLPKPYSDFQKGKDFKVIGVGRSLSDGSVELIKAIFHVKNFNMMTPVVMMSVKSNNFDTTGLSYLKMHAPIASGFLIF